MTDNYFIGMNIQIAANALFAKVRPSDTKPGWFTLWWSDGVANKWDEELPSLPVALLRLAGILYSGQNWDGAAWFLQNTPEEFEPRATAFLNATVAPDGYVQVGDRLRITGIMPNEPDPLAIGEMGTVTKVMNHRDSQQISVKWDSGRQLRLIDTDPFERVEE